MIDEKTIREELRNDSICPECNIEMVPTKRRKNNQYGKERTTFECSVCGFHHRKRTFNEILRDLGERI